MTRTRAVLLFVGVTVLLVGAVTAVYWFMPIRSSAVATTPASLPPGATAAPSAFLTDFDAYLALQKDVARRRDTIAAGRDYKTMQDEQDRASGMAQRLSAEVPQGSKFDPKLRAFVLNLQGAQAPGATAAPPTQTTPVPTVPKPSVPAAK